MSDSVFTRTHPLPAGPRVRLRLARATDRAGVERLLHQRGTPAGELDVLRLLRFDPTRRTVLAAFAPLDGVETLVGVAAADHDAELDTLVVDERLTSGLGELLATAVARKRRVA